MQKANQQSHGGGKCSIICDVASPVKRETRTGGGGGTGGKEKENGFNRVGTDRVLPADQWTRNVQQLLKDKDGRIRSNICKQYTPQRGSHHSEPMQREPSSGEEAALRDGEATADGQRKPDPELLNSVLVFSQLYLEQLLFPPPCQC